MSLAIKQLRVELGGHKILREVSAQFSEGVNIVVGPNGAGKSTLVNAAAGLIPFNGEILIKDASVPVKPSKRSELISLMSQNVDISTPVTCLSYLEHVDLAKEIWTVRRSKSSPEQLKAIMAELGVEQFANQFVGDLSGGQVTRVRLARALYQNTPVALFDEPTAALDFGSAVEVMRLLKSKFTKKIAVVVMHDLTLASRFADSIFLMDSGKIVASGNPVDVLTPELLSKTYQTEASVNWIDGVAQVSAV